MAYSLKPGALVLTVAMLDKDLERMETQFREILCGRLEGQKVVITIDYQTSVTNECFNGMIAHWINDEWEPESEQLECFLHKSQRVLKV
jgi:hypothetical protein